MKPNESIPELPIERFDEVAELAEACLRDEISDERLVRLEALVVDDPHARRMFAVYLQGAHSLRVWANGQDLRDGDGQDESPVPGQTSPVLGFLGVVAEGVNWHTHPARFFSLVVALTLSTWCGFYLFTRPDLRGGGEVAERSGEKPPPFVAQLRQAVDCQWGGPADEAPTPGIHLRKGRVLDLKSGVAEIRFDSGAGVALEGPAKFALAGENAGNLQLGRLSARVPEEAIGFSLDTPSTTVVDLGTEFGVAVYKNETTDVHVFAGLVQVRAPGAMDGAVQWIELAANEARRFSTHNVEEISADVRAFKQDKYDRDPAGLSVPPEYAAAVRDADPVCYWRFERTVGAVVENEASDRHDVRIVGDVTIVGDERGKSASFGTNGYLVADDALDDLEGDGYAIECWVRPDGYRKATLAGLLAGDMDGYAVMVELQPDRNDRPPASVRFLHRTPPGSVGGTRIYSPAKTYVPHRWHHVVASKSGSRMSLYVDGDLVGSDTDDSRLPGSLRVVLGRISPTNDGETRQFTGRIDEIAVYPHGLAEQTIRRHYQLIRPK